jgi:hypothetical protein
VALVLSLALPLTLTMPMGEQRLARQPPLPNLALWLFLGLPIVCVCRNAVAFGHNFPRLPFLAVFPATWLRRWYSLCKAKIQPGRLPYIFFPHIHPEEFLGTVALPTRIREEGIVRLRHDGDGNYLGL